MWEMEKVKQSRKGSKTYTYWMASWREDGKTRNVHLGSARKMDGAGSPPEGQGDEGGGAGDAGAFKTFFMNRSLERSRKEDKDPDSPAWWEKHQPD